MRIFILSITIVFFSGCGYIARKGYGAKKQHTETKESIEKWLAEKELGAEKIVSVSPKYYYDFIPGLSQAPLLFDNRSGTFLAIGFSNGEYCPKEIDKSFSATLPYNLIKEKPDSFLVSETIILPPGVSIKDKSKYELKKDTLHLSLLRMIEKTRTLSGENVDVILKEDYDYVLYIPFALFLGNKVQLQDIKQIYYSALMNRYSKIDIVFLNLDKQKWWGEEWNNKININY